MEQEPQIEHTKNWLDELVLENKFGIKVRDVKVIKPDFQVLQ